MDTDSGSSDVDTGGGSSDVDTDSGSSDDETGGGSSDVDTDSGNSDQSVKVRLHFFAAGCPTGCTTVCIYTVSQKKTRHQTLVHNFPKC